MKFSIGNYVKTTRFKTTLWYTSIFLLLEFVLGILIYIFFRQALYRELDASLLKQADTIYHLVKESKIDFLNFQPDSLYSSTDEVIYDLIFETVTLNPNNTFVQISISNKIVFSTANLNKKKIILPEANTEEAELFTYLDSNLSEHPIRVVSLEKGRYSVIVAFPVILISQTLDKFVRLYIFIAPLFLFLSVIGGALISNKSLSRIDKIIQKTDEITTQNLEEIIEGGEFNDEYGRLVKTMNEMIKRIRTSIEYMDQFTISASHELKTPLTILRGEIELALKSNKTPEQYREILNSNYEETLKLINVVNRLFYLSKFDHSLIKLNKQKISVPSLIKETLQPFKDLAEEKNMHLVYNVNEETDQIIDGDPDLLQQVFVNLIENAIKYGNDKSDIMVNSEPVGEKFQITFTNDCEYISSESLDKLFDRFFRDESSRNKGLGGVGLGLSVVKSIINLHNGRISANYSEGKITFTILL
jgi:two-component system heavy metal sensor histidine kinase CusS